MRLSLPFTLLPVAAVLAALAAIVTEARAAPNVRPAEPTLHVRERGPLVIAETRHGFICASAGVDHSNAPAPGTLVLLPLDPDASARGLRERFRELTGRDVGVVVTDSFGRPFRQGTTDVAIGVAGITALRDLRGTRDRQGYVLRASRVALADEIASAADLARGKADGVPVVLVRGLQLDGDGTSRDLVIEPELDLFR